MSTEVPWGAKPSSARCDYINALVQMEPDSEELLDEIEQLLVDLMDVTEQSDTEAAVIAAHEAFKAARPSKGAAS